MVLTKNDLQQIKEALDIESIINTSINDIKKSIASKIDELNSTLEIRLTNVEEILEKERSELAVVKKSLTTAKHKTINSK